MCCEINTNKACTLLRQPYLPHFLLYRDSTRLLKLIITLTNMLDANATLTNMLGANANMLNLSDVDPPLINWGRHSGSNKVTKYFNNLFGLKLTKEGWASLLVNVKDEGFFKSIIPNDVLTSIQRVIAVSTLLPIATHSW